MFTDPFAIDSERFGALLASVADCADDCACVTCAFINLIPVMLDAEGVEP
jgi:hypothetical protein